MRFFPAKEHPTYTNLDRYRRWLDALLVPEQQVRARPARNDDRPPLALAHAQAHRRVPERALLAIVQLPLLILVGVRHERTIRQADEQVWAELRVVRASTGTKVVQEDGMRKRGKGDLQLLLEWLR